MSNNSLGGSIAGAMAEAAHGAMLGEVIGQANALADQNYQKAQEWYEYAQRLEAEARNLQQRLLAAETKNAEMVKLLRTLSTNAPALVAEIDRLEARSAAATNVAEAAVTATKHLYRDRYDLMISGKEVWTRMAALEKALQITSADVVSGGTLITAFAQLIDSHGLAGEIPTDISQQAKASRDEFLSGTDLCCGETASNLLEGTEIAPSWTLAYFRGTATIEPRREFAA